MTREEKELKLLDALGLKVGDVVEVSPYERDPIKYTIIKGDDLYLLENDRGRTEAVSRLLRLDFEKVEKPKKWKDMKCGEVPCYKCPMAHTRCWTDIRKTLQDILNKTELDDEEREFYQKRIDRECKEE